MAPSISIPSLQSTGPAKVLLTNRSRLFLERGDKDAGDQPDVAVQRGLRETDQRQNHAPSASAHSSSMRMVLQQSMALLSWEETCMNECEDFADMLASPSLRSPADAADSKMPIFDGAPSIDESPAVSFVLRSTNS